MKEIQDSTILEPVGILEQLGEHSRQQLTAMGVKAVLEAGEVLIREGQKQDFLFILLSGMLEVTTDASGTPVRLGVLQPWDCFGEMGMLEGTNASATVAALQETRVWSLNVDQFEVFLSQNNLAAAHILLAIARTLSQRLREANRMIREQSQPTAKLSVRKDGEPEPIKYDLEHKPARAFSIFKSGPKEYPKAKIPANIKVD